MGSTIILGGSLDRTTAQNRSLLLPEGNLLFEDSNFDDGYRGWEELYSTTEMAPISLSPYPALGGLALHMSTSSKRSTVNAGKSYAIKRLMRPSETSVIAFETLWSFGSESMLLNPFDIEWLIDTCNYANTQRSFYRFRYCLTDGTSFSRVNELRSRKNEVLGGTSFRNSGITLKPAYNQNKQNINRTVCVINLAGNSGKGEYVSFEVNGTKWIMEGTEAGEAAEELVQGGGEAGNFGGGLNFVTGILGNSHEDVGHAFMNVCAARAYIL